MSDGEKLADPLPQDGRPGTFRSRWIQLPSSLRVSKLEWVSLCLLLVESAGGMCRDVSRVGGGQSLEGCWKQPQEQLLPPVPAEPSGIPALWGLL